MARLGERPAEAGRDGRLALRVEGAGDQHDVRPGVGREREAERGAEGLVALVLDPGERPPAAREPAPDVGHGAEHRQVDQAAELAGAGDARHELVARERDQDADEEAEEEGDDGVARGLRRAAIAGGVARCGDREVIARSGERDAELRQPLLDRLHLLRRARLDADAVELLREAGPRLLVLPPARRRAGRR